MKLFEYMGKELFTRYGIPVPPGKVCSAPEEVAEAVKEIGSSVIKSQVLIGKRGKAGGIAFVDDPVQGKQEAERLFAMEIGGYPVQKVLVEGKLQIDKELYLSIAVDGACRSPLILASAQGGMDIEDVPDEHIVRRHLNIFLGVQPYIAREIAVKLGLDKNLSKQLSQLLQNLFRAYREMDAELVEINPLVISGDKLIAADAKVTIDDDAEYRHQDLPAVTEEKTELEKKAQALGLAYVELDGDIAVMANGAGITMATLDMLQHYGGRPANFLDAGGGAGVEPTAQALELLLGTNPKAIFINIFGGITRCDDVAQAFATVKQTRGIDVPVSFRLVGTNEEEGRRILEKVGIQAFETMDEGARKAVELAGR